MDIRSNRESLHLTKTEYEPGRKCLVTAGHFDHEGMAEVDTKLKHIRNDAHDEHVVVKINLERLLFSANLGKFL